MARVIVVVLRSRSAGWEACAGARVVQVLVQAVAQTVAQAVTQAVVQMAAEMAMKMMVATAVSAMFWVTLYCN